MKIITALFLSVTILIGSCEKDDDQQISDPENPHGLWIGTYTIDQIPAAGARYYSFIIKPNGNILTESDGGSGNTYYSKGTWNITNDSIYMTYTTINYPGPAVTQTAKFRYNKTERTFSGGTWKDGANGSNYTGTFPTMLIVD